MNELVKVHDIGHVKLETSMGDDLSIVNAARVSFNTEHATLDDDSDSGLINYLMKHKHGTPFEMVQLAFDIKLPIFVMREQIRHRIGSFNEMSARYTEMLPEFYVPAESYVRTQTGKPGHYNFEPISKELSKAARVSIRHNNIESWAKYRAMMESGVAKEVARIVLPVNIYTRCKWSVNLRSLLNYLALRNDSRALQEIHDYAEVIEMLATKVAPITMKTFQENGRVAP